MRAFFVSIFALSFLGCGISSADLKVTDAVIATKKPNIIFNLNFEKDLTNTLSSVKQNFSTFIYKDKLYLTGGDTSSIFLSDNEVYDLKDFSFQKKASFPSRKSGFGTSIIGNYLYIVGGFNGATASNEMEVYDLEKDTWDKKSVLLTKRTAISVATLNDKIYAIGGSLENNNISDAVEFYTPSDDNWRGSISQIRKPRRHSSSIVVKNKIYLIGGDNSEGVTDMVEEYNPKTDQWKIKSPLPTPRTNLRTVAIDDYIITLGGTGKDNKPTKTVEIFNTTNNTWVKGNDLNEVIDGFGAIYNNLDNKIYILGGTRNGTISNKISSYSILKVDSK